MPSVEVRLRGHWAVHGYTVALRYLSAVILCILLWSLTPATSFAHALQGGQSDNPTPSLRAEIKQTSADVLVGAGSYQRVWAIAETSESIDCEGCETTEHCVTCTVSALPAVPVTVVIPDVRRAWHVAPPSTLPNINLLPPDRPPQI